MHSFLAMLNDKYSIVLCLMLTKLSSPQSSDFCQTGQLDSAVRTQNGRIFIFFGSYLIELSEDLRVKNRNPTPLRERFRDLTFHRIDASFTADGQNNPNRGKTYLIGNNIIKEYQDLRPTGLQSDISEWLSLKTLRKTDLVINQIGDPIAIFFGPQTKRQGIEREYILYYFDSVTAPAMVSAAKIIENKALMDWPLQKKLELRAVVGLFNDSYLVLYNGIDGSNWGKYCVTKELNEGCKYFADSTQLCGRHSNNTLPVRPTRPNPSKTSQPKFKTTKAKIKTWRTTDKRYRTTKKRTIPKNTKIVTKIVSTEEKTISSITRPQRDNTKSSVPSKQITTVTLDNGNEIETTNSAINRNTDKTPEPSGNSIVSWLLIVLLVVVCIGLSVAIFATIVLFRIRNNKREKNNNYHNIDDKT